MRTNYTASKWVYIMLLGSIYGISCFGVERIERHSISLTVHSDKTIGHIDKRIYGQFLEHIYRSCSNGIWGEIVWNRSFEERLSSDQWSVRDDCLVSPVGTLAESLFVFDRPWNVSEVKMEFMRLSGTGDVLAGLNCSGNNRYLVVLGADGQHRLENQGSVVQTTKGQIRVSASQMALIIRLAI